MYKDYSILLEVDVLAVDIELAVILMIQFIFVDMPYCQYREISL